MKLYYYSTNIYDNKGQNILIVGSSKQKIEKAFKYFNVKAYMRQRECSSVLLNKFKTIDELLEAQKESLSMRLKLKQAIIKEDEENE